MQVNGRVVRTEIATVEVDARDFVNQLVQEWFAAKDGRPYTDVPHLDDDGAFVRGQVGGQHERDSSDYSVLSRPADSEDRKVLHALLVFRQVAAEVKTWKNAK